MPFDWLRIREFRQSVGMTQQQFGEILAVPQSTVARWETGKISPNAHHIGLMCDLGRVRSIEPEFFFPPFSRLDPVNNAFKKRRLDQ